MIIEEQNKARCRVDELLRHQFCNNGSGKAPRMLTNITQQKKLIDNFVNKDKEKKCKSQRKIIGSQKILENIEYNEK